MCGGREKEAQEVHALLKCSAFEYETALEMARKGGTKDSGESQGPQPSAKVVLAANALAHILNAERPASEQPAPEKPAPERTAPERPPEPRFREPRMLKPGNFSYKPSDKILFYYIAAAMSPILYGPIHFLAWNDNFPTSMERLFWRVSSIVVTCSGLGAICVAIFFMILGVCLPCLPFKFKFDDLGFVLSIFVIPAMHMLASGYLLVESFRQLASLDSTAYQLPSWSYYWPHIS